MALARVVAFEGVTKDRIEQLRGEMESADGPPEDIPASELLILHDPEGERSLAIVFFENEADYARGHAALDAMPTEGTPGRRTSISKYEVAIRMSPQGTTA
jgi:hypothetical protein